jgi:hypothetical protein
MNTCVVSLGTEQRWGKSIDRHFSAHNITLARVAVVQTVVEVNLPSTMSFRRACAHWDAFGHEQPGRFDVASWMRARGVSDVGREVENHQNQ